MWLRSTVVVNPNTSNIITYSSNISSEIPIYAILCLFTWMSLLELKGCRNYQNDDTRDDSEDNEGVSRKLSGATSIAKEDLRNSQNSTDEKKQINAPACTVVCAFAIIISIAIRNCVKEGCPTQPQQRQTITNWWNANAFAVTVAVCTRRWLCANPLLRSCCYVTSQMSTRIVTCCNGLQHTRAHTRTEFFSSLAHNFRCDDAITNFH